MEQFYLGSLIGKTLFAARKLPVYNSTVKGSKIAFYVEAKGSIGIIKAVVSGYKTNSGTQYFMVQHANGKVYFVPTSAPIDSASLKSQGALTLSEKAKEDKRFNDKQEGGLSYYLSEYGPKVALAAAVIIFGKTYIQAKLK
jgi:hypothetical protein